MEYRQRRMVAAGIVAAVFLLALFLIFFQSDRTRTDPATSTVSSAIAQNMPTQLPVRPASDEKNATEAAHSSRERTPQTDWASSGASPIAGAAVPIPDWMNRIASIPQNTVCPADAAGIIEVSTADQLHAALANAQPGDRISLADGRYTGSFEISVSGAQGKRIWICGSRNAILDGGDWHQGVALHISGDYIGVWGITLSTARHGIVVDGGQMVQIDNVDITAMGEEGIRFFQNAADGVIQDAMIHGTGLLDGDAGVGIVIGSSVADWVRPNDDAADHTDRIHIARNRIWGTTAESIRIHPGAQDGVLEFNSLDGTTIHAAGAWVDIFGSGFTIRGNVGINAPGDGFQTHTVADITSGSNNQFITNTAQIGGSGYGFYIQEPETTQNTIACNNFVNSAAAGFANIPCSDTIS